MKIYIVMNLMVFIWYSIKVLIFFSTCLVKLYIV
jgi:hypothetical protein